MRRYRRLVMVDRVIPFLAALVGLVALAGAVTVQINADAKTRAMAEAVAELRRSIDTLAQPVVQLKPAETAADPAVAEMEQRLTELEAALAAQKATAVAATITPAETATAEVDIDPNLPTTDCIPLGTRFMVVPFESFPLCQSSVVLKTGAITEDAVNIEQAGTIVETGFGQIAGSGCTVSVFTADAAGFAEVRVSCS
ncbi:MAG: hypothetical protein ACO1OG_05050 [Devosia sp.]